MEQRTGGSSKSHLPGAVVLNQLEADVSSPVPAGSVSIWVLLPPCVHAAANFSNRNELECNTSQKKKKVGMQLEHQAAGPCMMYARKKKKSFQKPRQEIHLAYINRVEATYKMRKKKNLKWMIRLSLISGTWDGAEIQIKDTTSIQKRCNSRFGLSQSF